MFENKVTLGSLPEGGTNPWKQVLVSIWKSIFTLCDITKAKDYPCDWKVFYWKKTQIALRQRGTMSSIMDLLKTSSSYSSIQSCPFGLWWHIFLVHRNACFFSLVFGLFSLFNVMLKVIWGTYLQNTLFLLMCDMWKNHLQRGWGGKGSAGQDHGHFFFLFLLLPLPVSGLSLISYIVAHLLMCPSL